MDKGNSRANENKAIRQQALRDKLSAGGHVQHVLDISDKLQDLTINLTNTEAGRLKSAADIKLKLIDKYLASLKAVEMTGANGDSLIPSSIELVRVSPKS